MSEDLFDNPTLPPGVSPKRGKSYLWVSWLTSLLAGDDTCLLQPWLKVHYRFPEVDHGSFDLSAWKAQHAAMVELERLKLESESWSYTVEDQNTFKLDGTTAIIGGKPDLIASRDGAVRVIDLKGGKKRGSDYQQVLIYMFALPRIAGHYPRNLHGEVVYRPEVAPRHVVQPTELTPEWIASLAALVRRLASRERPVPRPSARECAFCKVPASLCPQRVDEPAVMAGTTEEF